MTYDDIIRHFGDEPRARAALGASRGRPAVSRQQAHYWKAHGIPRSVQCEFQIITAGALVADPAPQEVA